MSLLKFLVSKAFVKQIVLAIIIIIALVFVTRWWLGSTTNHDERIAVPNVKGMTLDLVSQELENADLRYFIIDSANFNPNYPKYSVIDQEPNAGKFVKENRQIYLVLNPSGYQKMTIPPIVGKTRRQAEPSLKALGFEIGKVTYVDWIGKDEVRDIRHKGKRVKAGDRLEKTSVIDLVLGNGKGDYRDAISDDSSDEN
ncbi:PASTA domain-containing protein [Dokdonia sp. Hel_I_63]|uniref:PASTA domain-containing protein n=1 Tax=unclassified Dokdonia TaxID=2615033 RepID=UPI00020A60F2|nr:MULTISPECIES: PASTA domain-containing protein [unclassified Dokdonia]AEE19948.1 PASTA domain containing protein [Dokdonia sp. 4H-3-7-5]TVZ23834.1 PASTA domain-containing protein [Dokdonia sp. Hel_I_63]